MVIIKPLTSWITSGRNIFWRKTKPKFGTYAIVQPQTVSGILNVPDHIQKPYYYETGIPEESPPFPEIKSEHDIKFMRDSCRLAANILKAMESHIKVGVTTNEIDILAHEMIIQNNAYPSPLNYHNYPKSICTSVNNVACHGIPDDRPLANGDIINVDITVYLNGFHGDCSKTFMIGDVDEKGQKLVEASEICLNEAITLCKPGIPFRDIGSHIEKRAFELGFNVVPCFVGHGIGSYFHGLPEIYHFTNDAKGAMVPGMTFTIEPVISQGSREIEVLEDNWTAVTIDNARTGQFEHTILITDNGHEILTLPSQD